MVYSLFYCSLLLALFPLFGSSTIRSSLRCHTLLTAPPHAPRHPPTLLRLFQISLLTAPPHAPRHPLTLCRLFQISLLTAPPLAPHYAVTRSSSPSHAPQALPPLAPYRTTTRSALRNHSLHATLPRSKIPLNTPCFVTRNIMAEGAKKHDDFRLPT